MSTLSSFPSLSCFVSSNPFYTKFFLLQMFTLCVCACGVYVFTRERANSTMRHIHSNDVLPFLSAIVVVVVMLLA